MAHRSAGPQATSAAPPKSRARKILVAGLLVLAAVAALALVFQKPISRQLLQQLVQRQAGRDIVPSLPDGLHVALCGTGSPMPDPTRAGPCTAVIAGQRLFVVDAGEGSARVLGAMGIGVGGMEALLLTHFHSDHIDGLGNMLLQRWASSSAQQPLPIYGPPGVEDVVEGFRSAYTQDYGYRTTHHSAAIMPPGGSGAKGVTFTLPAPPGDRLVLLQDKGLTITAFRVNHGPVEPAVGYRFDYQGRSVVITGDTVRTPSVVAIAQGADLLVHEALQPTLLRLITNEMQHKGLGHLQQILSDIENYHTTPEEAAQQANAAQVKHLVFNHIVPPMPLPYGYPAFIGDAGKYFAPPITVGEDGMLFSMPAGSDAITLQKTN